MKTLKGVFELKKYLLLLVLALLTALYGCAEEKKEEVQPLIQPDINVPDTLTGSYDISYFSIQDSSQIISDNCTQAVNGAPVYDINNTCEQISELISHRVGIQKHWDTDKYIYSVVIQLQLNSQNIIDNVGDLRNTAYRHIIFPIQEAYFPASFGVDAVSKASDRGLERYYVGPVYGDRTKTNAYIQALKIENDKLVFSLKTNDEQKTYIFKLKKISNDSGNYVLKLNVEYPQGGLYADSIIKNTPLVTTSDNATYDDMFNQFFAIFE